MIQLGLAAAAAAVDGRLVGKDAAFTGVSSDTRALRPGSLFVALRGPNFDGHDFLAAAAAAGAAGALVESAADTELPGIVVADTLQALGRLANHWRACSAARVIGLTGSNGKTTLKEMLAAILACRGRVMATLGNLNNAIGVPLTLCRLGDEQFAVIEMGANHAGEIDYLTRLVQPDIAILNNAGRAHLEGFGSLEGVARAKAEIINGLGDAGTFVFNADDRFAPMWRELATGRRQRTFGVSQPADVASAAGDYRVDWREGGFEARFAVTCEQGSAEVALRLAGAHNRMNALAAIAAALEAGATLADAVEGLSTLRPVPGRLCPVPAMSGATLVDDSYNANPDSVLAALQVLAAAPGRRTLVLGDLAELGADAGRLHRQLGESAAAAGMDRLLTCGVLSREASQVFPGEARHFDDRDALVEALRADLGADDVILVKGSRSARMDEVVASLAAGVGVC
jgi:UDP-N-acetylmuramoyl-tripeptide--D-alanyl-D-alanine ligase